MDREFTIAISPLFCNDIGRFAGDVRGMCRRCGRLSLIWQEVKETILLACWICLYSYKIPQIIRFIVRDEIATTNSYQNLFHML